MKHLDMVRLSAGLLAALALLGCNGLITGEDDPGISPEEKLARQVWIDKGLPAFQSATCTTCHNGSQANIGFLAGGDDASIRQTLLTFDPQVANLDAPQSSRVLTKGSHAGPSLDAVPASDILTWLQAEQAAAGVTGGGSLTLTTNPFTPLLCTSGTSGSPTCPFNHVGLAAVGMTAPTPVDLTGAEITFVVQPLSDSMYVTDLTATAGAAGLYVEHPLFVYIPVTGQNCSDGAPGPCPDTIDRFFATKVDLMASTSSQIDGGTAAFSGFAPVTGAQLQITFKVVDKYRDPASGGGGGGGGGGGTTGGCKVLTGTNSFQTLIVPKLTTGGNPCTNCHAGTGNANALSAMDINGINSTDTSPTGPLQMSCNQVRTRVNFQTPAQSGVELAPDPAGDAAHPFKLSGTSNPTLNAFDTAFNTWIQAEATAP